MVFFGAFGGGLSADPDWTTCCELDIDPLADEDGSSCGHSVSGAGDLNADGYDDVVVGSPYYGEWDFWHQNRSQYGKAYVFHGSASGPGAAVWTRQGSVEENFGFSVAGAGDTNGDGFSEIIIGNPTKYIDAEQRGRVEVWTERRWNENAGPYQLFEQDGPQAGGEYGHSLGTAGDVNGDGYADIIIGAPNYDGNGGQNHGRAELFLGGVAGLSSATPDWTMIGAAETRLGDSASTAGDTNGDGLSDVILAGSEFQGGDQGGVAYLYFGQAQGLSLSPAWAHQGEAADLAFGWSVSSAGDIDADGFSDVIIGAPEYDGGKVNEGRAYLFRGGRTGLLSDATWTYSSAAANAKLGYSVSSAGDVNGDGYDDVIVGTPFWQSPTVGEGRVQVFLANGAGSLNAAPVWSVEGNATDAKLGWSVASAGDVNGDGRGDIIVGAPGRQQGAYAGEGRADVYLAQASTPFLPVAPSWSSPKVDQATANVGYSVAGAGDVDADGFSDVAIGAPSFDFGGLVNRGRVVVHRGSAGGVGAVLGVVFLGENSDNAFGATVEGAGDTNGDGRSDLLVGAPGFSNGQLSEGKAYAYNYVGGAWSLMYSFEGAQTGAQLGWSAAGGCDFNNDGFCDVSFGAPYVDDPSHDEGAAVVRWGSINGPTGSGSWSSESDLPDAHWGWSVACAGDVNGDGISDLIVGAPDWQSGFNRQGVAKLFYGRNGDGIERLYRHSTTTGAPLALLGSKQLEERLLDEGPRANPGGPGTSLA